MGDLWWMHSLLNDPRHWRDRAEEARRIAAMLKNAEPKRLMLSVADSYDRLAEHAELRLVSDLTQLPGAA